MSTTSSFTNSASFGTRLAKPTDVAPIVEIELNSFVHPGERFSERRVRYLIDSPRAIVRVSEFDGVVMGWIAGFAVTRSSTPWGRIYALAVDPAAQGKGIGKQLLSEMVHLLRESGVRRIFLEVRPDNQPALRLYAKFGFAPCNRLEDFYGKGHPALRMILSEKS